MKTHTVNGTKLTSKQFNWLKKKAGTRKFTSKEASKLLTKAKSTPRMGVSNKMYKTSVPAMKGPGGGGRTVFTDIGDFFSGRPIGKQFETQYTAEQQQGFQKQATKGLPPGAVRWGKGTYRMPGSDVSIPIMGPIGALIGATAGAKLGGKIGKWIGSAGRLIGPKHRQYGEQAGTYVGNTLGGALGGTLGLGAVPF